MSTPARLLPGSCPAPALALSRGGYRTEGKGIRKEPYGRTRGNSKVQAVEIPPCKLRDSAGAGAVSARGRADLPGARPSASTAGAKTRRRKVTTYG